MDIELLRAAFLYSTVTKAAVLLTGDVVSTVLICPTVIKWIYFKSNYLIGLKIGNIKKSF